MGCHVTSIYADQVIGKISYPDSLINDLVKRDYPQPFKFEHKSKLTSICEKIKSIYGFTQSYSQAFAFTTVIQQKQFLLYNNGRFLIKILKAQLLSLKEMSDYHMDILPHQDDICAMDLNDNMCVVGVSGGKLVLWDLKFNEIKIEITMPKPSASVSSISLTKKYIFVTDNTLPSNIVYCFDIQTAKLKSKTLLSSLEPTLKGIRFQQNHHIIISAEGVWFIRYSATENTLQIIKGMFTMYPKTSQTSITNIDNKYVVSGGVDGYIYIWNAFYQCIKVIKCYEKQQAISAIAYNKQLNTLVMGSYQDKVKVFLFKIKLMPKKQQSENNLEKQQDIECLLNDAYEDQFGIQTIVLSKEDIFLYFIFNHSGKMSSHLLPSNQPYPNRIKDFSNIQIFRHSRRGQIRISSKPLKSKLSSTYPQSLSLINVYPFGRFSFNIDTVHLSENQKWFEIGQKTFINTKIINPKYSTIYSYSEEFNCVAYVHQNQIFVAFHQNDRHEIQSIIKKTPPSKQDKYQRNDSLSLSILSLQIEELVGVNYLTVGTSERKTVYFFITFEQHCLAYQVRSKTEYILDTSVKFLKQKYNNFKISQESLDKDTLKAINTLQVCFDDIFKVWKIYTPDKENIEVEIQEQNRKSNQNKRIQHLSKIHTASVKLYHKNQNFGLSVGGNSIIFWNQ